jgi:uncharacterized RmlC-like cupin family protein
VKPGDLIVVPRGVPHGGFTDPMKIVVIQTPPRPGTDVQLLP